MLFGIEPAAVRLREEFLAELATPMVAESLFAAVPDIVFCIKNSEGQYISANMAFVERLGLQSISEILGKRAVDIFPEHLAVTYQRQDEIVLDEAREITDQLELVFNRDRSLGWYLASKIPLFGQGEKVIGLASISRDLLTPGSETLRIAGLANVVKQIQARFAEPLKPAELAEQAGFTNEQLERRMRRVFKLSTSQFIRKTRIDSAVRMLRETDKAIIDIAMDAGYGDQSAFTRQFKATVGMAPGRYRRLWMEGKGR